MRVKPDHTHTLQITLRGAKKRGDPEGKNASLLRAMEKGEDGKR